MAFNTDNGVVPTDLGQERYAQTEMPVGGGFTGDAGAPPAMAPEPRAVPEPRSFPGDWNNESKAKAAPQEESIVMKNPDGSSTTYKKKGRSAWSMTAQQAMQSREPMSQERPELPADQMSYEDWLYAQGL